MEIQVKRISDIDMFKKTIKSDSAVANYLNLCFSEVYDDREK